MVKDTVLEKIAYLSFVLNMISIFCLSYKEDTLMYSNIIFAINAILMLVAIVMRNKEIKINRLYIWLICMLGWCLASTLWSLNSESALTKCWTIAQLFVYTGIIFEFFRYRSNAITEIFQAYFIGGLVMALYGFSIYGFSGITSALFGNYRLGEEINQINTFGMGTAFASVFGLYLYNSKNNKLYAFSSALLLLMSLGSGSTKALATIIYGIIVIYTVKIKKRNIISLVVLCVTLLSLWGIIQSGYEINILKRATDTIHIFTGSGYENTSSLLRLYYMQLGWTAFLEHPILGYGLGNFSSILLTTMGYATYAHNNYIEILVDLGIIGCVLYYSLYFKVLKRLYQVRKREHFMFYILLLILVLDIANVTYYSKETYILLTMFYIAINHVKNDGNTTDKEVIN
jgi:O-antigen ligase